MFEHGVVVGKFYPPHRGHKFLIKTALEQAKQVTVIVCSAPEQTIPGELRGEWLQEIHPEARVMVINDTLPDDDSRVWAENTIRWLGFVPDVVFTSEDYGYRYSRYLGAQHVQVDKSRVAVPVSATKIRKDPFTNWQYLEPSVRGHFAKRVCIIGAESSGTTTLVQDLARHYRTVWVPEFGRMYSEGKLLGETANEWNGNEFLFIAQQQQRLEDELAKQSNKIVFCDTNAFATSVWHERYLGRTSAALEQMNVRTRVPYALYILTGDEIPFVQDGTRDGEHVRHWMHDRFAEKLTACGLPYTLVRGTRSERLKAATKAIETALPWLSACTENLEHVIDKETTYI